MQWIASYPFHFRGKFTLQNVESLPFSAADRHCFYPFRSRCFQLQEVFMDFSIHPSLHFGDWLQESGSAIALSSYQAGKVLLLGRRENGGLRANQSNFGRCMGIAFSPDHRRMFLATERMLVRLDDFLTPGQIWEDGSDALFVPRQSWITGGLDIHDLCLDAAQEPIFVNTLFNCLGTLADGFNFRPLWKPAFISALVPEDRCHLNGLACENGQPRYVTAVAATDRKDGWREHRDAGGLVIDVPSGETVCAGLSMPHSPRLFGGKLWVLNSGRGELCVVDPANGQLEVVTRFDGYARGLAFQRHYAIVGLSLPRYETFSGLPLDAILSARKLEPRCGLSVVDLRSGRQVAGARIEGEMREIYDVQVIAGRHNPQALSLRDKKLPGLVAIASAER
ncbi:TIGR03032 family protein [Rhodobacter lacus]|uniref:TIGR03032 family protein n=1 Tax=Rhodobacter lacus TaxID=1641972 RepID=A0ABW5AE60_9RHOB